MAKTLGAELLPTGSLRLGGRGQVSELPGYAEGAWWVQDAAARMLAPETGAWVLDLCAAPGGKTLQLAEIGAKVTALDISGPRMARLAENLARGGLSAETVVADALHWEPETPFDAILLDAPCSATGTIRRHPYLPFVKDGLDAAELARLKEQLIDRACEMLRHGGVIVFCTCSLLWKEGEGQLAAMLERHSDLVLDPQDPPDVEPEWQARLSRFAPAASGFVAQPEPRSIGSFARGRQLVAGRFLFAGFLIEGAERSLWDLPMPDPEFEAELHDFLWLDDLAALGDTAARSRAQVWTFD